MVGASAPVAGLLPGGRELLAHPTLGLSDPGLDHWIVALCRQTRVLRLPFSSCPGALIASTGDLAALLQAEDLLIVDGPGALGLYRLELPAGADALATADRLRAAQGLVLSVDGPE